jgi:glutathione S-transferase
VVARRTRPDFSVKDILSGKSDYYASFPNVNAFMQRVQERPAFQRAMESTMPQGPPPM